MSLFDVLSKGFCSKKRQSNEILSQEEYKDKFLHGEDYIKRELYDEYISRRLSEEFGLKYNEKIKDRKSTRLNSSHSQQSRMPSSA